MRIKRLEIQGFKSFKDKAIIHFDHQITGIVGPNGCGKSNIVDAFFWVMGEQSYKHMRGTGSQDLIFNGSSKHAPVGFAEASLILEIPISLLEKNESLDAVKEISITRRIYRSGEGEYLINGAPARLKEIHEFFMDTGVGTNGYSVIEQGQIEKIINAKPEERRIFIEEAASIAKYKSRRKECLKKMEFVQINLARLEDIIQEIEKNVNSLEHQAKKAKQYQEYKKQLSIQEIAWGRKRKKTFEEHLKQSNEAQAKHVKELEEAQIQFQGLEKEIELGQTQVSESTHDVQQLQLENQEILNQSLQFKNALELCQHRQLDLSDYLEKLENEKKKLDFVLIEDKKNLAQLKNKMETILHETEKVKEEEAKKAQIRDQFLSEFHQKQQEKEILQQQWISKTTKISELNSSASVYFHQEQSYDERKNDFLNQLEIKNEKIHQLEKEIKRFQSQLKDFDERKSSLNEEKTKHQQYLQSLEQDLKKIQENKNQAFEEIIQLRSKLASLEELNETDEALSHGSKAALKWIKSKKQKSLFHLLSDLISVKKGSEFLLENWLENKIENFIPSSLEGVIDLFSFLKNENQGRIAFQFPQDRTIHFNEKSFEEIKDFLNQQGFKVLGELKEWITIHPDYRDQFEFLFSNVCVVKQGQPIFDLIKTEKKNFIDLWSIISQDGVVWSSEGILKGGSLTTNKWSERFKRKDALAALQPLIQQTEMKHDQCSIQLQEEEKKLQQNQIFFQNLQNKIQELEIHLIGIKSQMEPMMLLLQETELQKMEIEKNLDQFDHDICKVQEQKKETEQQLEHAIEEKNHLELNLKILEDFFLNNKSITETREQEFQSILLKKASLNEKAHHLKRELEMTNSLFSDRKAQFQKIEKDIHQTMSRKDENLHEQTQFMEKLEKSHLQSDQLNQILKEKELKNSQFNLQLKEKVNRFNQLRQWIDQKTKVSHQHTIEIEKNLSELNYFVLNLEEKYGKGCLESCEKIENESIESYEEIEELREKILKLGEVNMMAVQEFEQFKKRYDLLSQEREDLQISLKDLKKALDTIDQTSKIRFEKAFDAICTQFQHLFPLIFGGGQAKLSLLFKENSKDIFEAGIEIFAQPPGKKIANLSLLSGGEKALTAISLIFSIFMLKPSPFCILDEVDAPLDDTNIEKFNTLLKAMATKSQFILITHNKKTMELNDALYGVTMEELGVSKMVSIEMKS